MRQKIPIGGVLTICFVVIVAVFSIWIKSQLADSRRATLASLSEPILTYPNIVNLDGSTQPLASLTKDKKITVIAIFATWCSNCRVELSQLEKSYAAYHDRGFQVVGVSVDQDPAIVRRYVEQRKYTFPVVVDAQGGLLRMLKLKGVPVAVLIDEKQNINGVFEGGIGDIEKVVKLWVAQ